LLFDRLGSQGAADRGIQASVLFQDRPGIDLPGESAGVVPDAKWKEETVGDPWTIGDTYNFGIGQGYLSVTPLQMVTAISAIGKAVTGLTDLNQLWNRIVEGAVYMAQADRGWLLVRSSDSQALVLGAGRNLPPEAIPAEDQPWEDEISSLAVASAEPLTVHGEALRRFPLAALGQAALVVPLRFREDVVGLLGIARKTDKPFNSSDQTLLQAMADYAAIAMVNASLIHRLEDGGVGPTVLIGG